MALDAGGHWVGVEVTEAISINAAHASVIRQSGIGPEAALIMRATPGEAAKTRAELIKEIDENAGGAPWEGDAPEREWADAMAHVTARKVTSSRKSGYARFAKNWLLVYDNWQLPAVRLSDAATWLTEAFRYSDTFAAFDSVFVLSGDSVCEFTAAGFALFSLRHPSA